MPTAAPAAARACGGFDAAEVCVEEEEASAAEEEDAVKLMVLRPLMMEAGVEGADAKLVFEDGGWWKGVDSCKLDGRHGTPELGAWAVSCG